MTQASDWDSEFTPTVEMIARHEAWVGEYAEVIYEGWRAKGQVDNDPIGAREAIELVRSEMRVVSRPDWMHPLEALAIKTMGEPDEIPTGQDRVDHFDSMRTDIGIGAHQRAVWTARSLGVGLSTVKRYDPDRSTYDLRGPNALYRYFDPRGRLLYVGISKDPDNRDREHRQYSIWRGHATDRTIEWFDDRDGALRAERAAIRDESPLFNRVGVTDNRLF